MGYTTCPGRVRLAMGEEKFVVAKKLGVDSESEYDFVIGRTLLSKYRCALDYSKFRLIFNVHDKIFKTYLSSEETDDD